MQTAFKYIQASIIALATSYAYAEGIVEWPWLLVAFLVSSRVLVPGTLVQDGEDSDHED